MGIQLGGGVRGGKLRGEANATWERPRKVGQADRIQPFRGERRNQAKNLRALESATQQAKGLGTRGQES